jgi:hypothetical protein
VSGGADSKRVGCVGGGREKRDVGTSMSRCAGGRLGKRRELTGGVHGPDERELTNERLALTGRTNRTEGGSECMREGKLAPIGWPH